jgi:glycosyltransferase involved in cell wall biosynthesis
MNWICCQIGAREHYAVARALHQGKRLASLYTDFWAGQVTRAVVSRWKWGQSRKQKVESRNVGSAFGALQSLAVRFHPDLDTGKSRKQKAESRDLVHSWNLRALWWEAIVRRKQKAESGNGGQRPAVSGRYFAYLNVGRRFAICVREAMKRRRDLGADSIFFAYDTGALEVFEWCKERGIHCVLDQMDPNRVEVDLVRKEEKRWSGWAMHPTEVPEAYFLRREKEWALADRVVVNSEFCRQALVKQGVPSEKLFVMPLAYEAAQSATTRQEDGCQKSEVRPPISDLRPLNVLFLGQVILRKGIQYLIEAARQLEKENIHFDVVGPIGISRDAIASAPRNVTFHGRATRDQATNWYRQASIFVLPTLSDGFAITQLEAMAYGLPVVTTPCCGDVVSDGVDGFIVPARDADALAKTFLRYLAEPDLLREQQQAALVKAKQFTLERLASNLLKLEAVLGDKR